MRVFALFRALSLWTQILSAYKLRLVQTALHLLLELSFEEIMVGFSLICCHWTFKRDPLSGVDSSYIAAMMSLGRTHTFHKLSWESLISLNSIPVMSIDRDLRVVETWTLVDFRFEVFLLWFWNLSIWNKRLKYMNWFINLRSVCGREEWTVDLIELMTWVVNWSRKRIVCALLDKEPLLLAPFRLHI